MIGALTSLLMLAVVARALYVIDRVSKARAHERLADSALKLALSYPHESAGYRQAMKLARFHAHKAGFDNGYRDDE